MAINRLEDLVQHIKPHQKLPRKMIQKNIAEVELICANTSEKRNIVVNSENHSNKTPLPLILMLIIFFGLQKILGIRNGSPT